MAQILKDKNVQTGLQFHATQEELVTWIAGEAGKRGLALQAERLGLDPWTVRLWPEDLVDDLAQRGFVDRILLSDRELPDASITALLKDVGYCRFNVGRLTDEGLTETAFGASWDDRDEERRKLWQSLRRSLAGSMRKGADAVNIRTGARVRVAGHGCMPGAEALYRSGTSLSAGGWVRYELT